MSDKFKDRPDSVSNRRKCFTLIEVIVVVSILGILAVIALPRATGLMHMVEERVCYHNCGQAARNYNSYLASLGDSHSEEIFSQFILDYKGTICPSYYVVDYENGEVKCSFHNIEDDEENNGEVPYL